MHLKRIHASAGKTRHRNVAATYKHIHTRARTHCTETGGRPVMEFVIKSLKKIITTKVVRVDNNNIVEPVTRTEVRSTYVGRIVGGTKQLGKKRYTYRHLQYIVVASIFRIRVRNSSLQRVFAVRRYCARNCSFVCAIFFFFFTRILGNLGNTDGQTALAHVYHMRVCTCRTVKTVIAIICCGTFFVSADGRRRGIENFTVYYRRTTTW